MPFQPKGPNEPSRHNLTWTPELQSYWAGYFDARHKRISAIPTDRYYLEAPSHHHLAWLKILHPKRNERLIRRYDGDGQLTKSWYRFTIDKPITPPGYLDKHYLRGWYDCRFKTNYSKDHKEIYLTGTQETTRLFRLAFHDVFHVKPTFIKYHADSDSQRYRLTGHAVDLFLGAIFDASCFDNVRWPKRFAQFHDSYHERKFPRLKSLDEQN